jgi:RNA polymerase sigma factor (sigma-70 family)
MARAAGGPILQLLRRVVEDGKVRELPDWDLVQWFQVRHDQAAFRTLLRRHGPMVLDVCRGVLGDGTDVEDAFQATFLVLAQKAGSIRKTAALGSWLHGVARRIALKARTQSAARRKHEARVPEQRAAQADDLSWREVRQVLHEALGDMPQRYREPLVLCYLEGATQQCAAARLGLAERTVRERLERGRELLRLRLVRRGLGPTAILAVGAWPAATVSAAVPAVLVDSTVKAATSVAAGGAAAAVVSAKAAALTRGVLRTMLLTKFKVTTAGLLAAALVLGGVLIPGRRALPQPSPAQHAAARRQEKPSEKESAKKQPVDKPPAKDHAGPPTWQIGPAVQQHGGRLWEVAFSADGKWLASSGSDKSVMLWDVIKRKTVYTLPHGASINAAAFAPDNKTLVTASGSPDEEPLIRFWDVETGKVQATLQGHVHMVHGLSFSKDGKVLVSCVSSVDYRFGEVDKGEVVFWDPETRKKITATSCDRVGMALLSHDGKKLVTSHSNGTAKLWDVDENFVLRGETVLVEGLVNSVRASPDRKTFIIDPVFVDAPTIEVRDFETGKVLQSFAHKEVSVRAVAFSPDGKTLVTGCQRKIKTGTGDELAGEVRFWDVATGQEKQVLSEKLGPVNSVAFAPDGRALAVGLHHKDNIKLKKEGKEGGYEEPKGGFAGAVVLCELKDVMP